MAGTVKKTGPLALTTTYTTNIYNNTSALLFDLIKQIHIVNKTSSAVSFRLYVGATGANAAGTELFFDYTVAAFSSYDAFFPLGLKLLSTDFLVGGASVTLSLVITITHEQFVV